MKASLNRLVFFNWPQTGLAKSLLRKQQSHQKQGGLGLSLKHVKEMKTQNRTKKTK